MDNLDDKSLRDVFGKLQGYESRQEGADWSAIEDRLPAKTPGSAWRIVALLILLMGIGTTTWINFTGKNNEPVSAQIVTTSPAVRSIPETRQDRPVNKSQDENLRSQLRPRIGSTDAVSKESTSVIPEYTAVKLGSPEMEAPKTTLVPSGDETSGAISHVSSLSDSVNTEDSPGEAEVKPSVKPVPVRFSIEAGYLFGIVNPNQADHYVIGNYRTRPGVGLKAGAEFRILSTNTFSIYTGPVVQLIYKPFLFDVTEFEERVTNYQVREVGFSTQFGASLKIVPIRSEWEAGVGFTRSFASSSMLGINMFTVTAARKIYQLSPKSALSVGASLSVPLTSEATYFRYSPIQLSLGLAMNR